MKQHQTNRFISRAAAMLLTVIIAFAGAQTAGAQGLELKPCFVKFDISSGGTVKFRGETVTNGQTIDFHIPSDDVLTITPKTGYVVSSVTVTHDATVGLSIDLKQKDDFQWNLNINPYGGSDTPTITVHIVFDKGLAGGADEALAVALTAVDDLSHLTGGWYKVESDLTFGHTMNLHGDTHITIATGATLTISTSDQYGISGSALTVSGEGTLNVSASYRAINVDNYTQTGCAVTLSGSYYGLNAMNDVSISGGSLTTSGANYGISTDNEAITISGGTVSSSGLIAGLFATKAMNITGGTVNASSNNYGIRGYSVSITGGQVTASSGGIWSNYGDITLGCTSATDYITASGYVLQNDGFYVKIADGQTLYGGGFPSASFKGTIVDPSALNGLMLRPTAAVTKSGTNEYTIWNAAGWDAFCDRLAADGGKAFFSGKTVKLGADIGSADNPITRRAGSADHDFTGQFNGQGHTLYVRLGTAEAPHGTKAAPLQNVTTVNSVAASIENLHVCGDIYASGKYAAGIIGSQYGNVTLRNCRSSVNIHSSAADDTSSGGLVGNGHDNLTIEGCLFDGSLTAEAADVIKCAGFVGYNSGTLTVSNSLVAPASVTIGTGTSGAISATFARGWSGTPANSYYTAPPSGGWGATQGKQARSITAGEGVNLGHDGVATEYSVSGITAYKATGASTDSDPFIAGLLYNNNVLYAGSDDEVSLTLAHQDREGYEFQSYTASAGTLSGDANPYTLTMPDADVTVTATWAKVYNLGNCWHVPAAAEPTGTYMRNPIHPYASLDVTIYNGNQAYEYEGENPGNPGDQSGGTIYYRAEGATAWQTVPMECDTEIENNKYWRGTIPANEFAEGNTVEYVIKVTYNEHDDTYLGLAAEGETTSTAFGTMAEAEAHPFSFKYLTPNTVDYIDENGQTQTVTATLLTDDLLNSDLGIDGATTWYVVNDNITHSGKITCRGNVNLILADGKTMTTSNPGSDAIYGANGTLTIYGQANGTGTLEFTANCYKCIEYNGNVAICGGTVNATSHNTAINVSGSVTICGGTVNISQALGTGIGGTGGVTINGGTITTSNCMIGIGGGNNGTVTINGGTVNATGQWGIRANGNVTINGGQVTATGTNGGQGIMSYGDIILGWTNATDFIKASSYQVNGSGTVNIADGQAFLTDDATPVQIKGTVSELSLIAGKKLTPDLSYAPEITVSYVKADGTTDTHQAKVLTGNETTLDAGWYVVISNINYTGTVSLAGDVHLILKDGCAMNVGTSSTYGINSENITIYGQTLGTGQLSVTSTVNDGSGIHSYEDITINGGKVTATAPKGIGIYAEYGTVAINGGNVEATGRNDGIIGRYGIILGWNKPTDRITASSYYCTGKSVTIAPGYAFHNGSEVLSGTISESDYATKLEGMTLAPAVVLADAADNTTAIATAATACTGGKTLAVQLQGRTLYKDGDWNTLCLPFAVDLTASGPLSGDNVQAMTLNGTTSNLNDGTLTLNFDAVATTGEQAGLIPAGTPFIIKWASKESPATDLVNPVFSGVTIDNSAEAIARKTVAFEDVSFVGTYDPVIIPSGGDNTKLYLGANNTLYWPNDAMTIGAFRAYFQLTEDAQPLSRFVLNFGDDGETQGISLTPGPSRGGEGSIYSLDGVKLGKMPKRKGLYIKNGKKVVIK